MVAQAAPMFTSFLCCGRSIAVAQNNACFGRDNNGDVCRRDQVAWRPTPAGIAALSWLAPPIPSVAAVWIPSLAREADDTGGH
jgi:hypothetical protein